MNTHIQKKEIHTAGFSRLKQVKEIVPMSDSGLWKWVKEGKFPAPVKVGKVTFWRNSDILCWLEQNGFEQEQQN